CKVEDNYDACRLHNKLRFPYHASMLLGYPGEREEDILESIRFIKETEPPSVGINWYVPLPGSPDYDKLRAEGIINTAHPQEWRRTGEANKCGVYADGPEPRFRELFKQAERLAYVDLPKVTKPAWGCIAPPQSEVPAGAVEALESGRAKATYGTAPAKLKQSA